MWGQTGSLQVRNDLAVTDQIPASPPRRPRRIGWILGILGIVGAFVLGIVIGGVGGAIGGATVASVARAAGATPAVAASDDPAGTLDTPLPTEEPSQAFEYTADTFTIKLKTSGKQCYGSAGCNLTVEPVLSTIDTSLIPDDASGTLTYEIDGGEDGPVIDTIDLTGKQYSSSSTVLSTTSSSKKPSVKITDVTTNPS